jgi:DNA-binding MarR family transcriptional regulator
MSGRMPPDCASAVQVIDDLGRLGLAVRQSEPADRRACRITLNGREHAVPQDAEARVAAADAEGLRPLRDAERRSPDHMRRRPCGWRHGRPASNRELARRR